MSIGSFSVKNRVFVNILMTAVLLLGALSLMRLPREQFSEVPFNWVIITVPWPGTSAEDIEKTVTVKIENAMEDMQDLKKMSSVSSEGVASLRLEFDDGLNRDEFLRLYQEVRTRFSGVVLPDGVLSPVLDDFSAADFLPVVQVILYGDTGFDLLSRTAGSLQSRLEGLSQVASAEIVGDRDRYIEISLDPVILESYGISLNQVSTAVASRAVSVPAGTVQTDLREYVLRTSGELEDFRAYADTVVLRGSSGGKTVRIEDLGKIREVYDPVGSSVRFNGRPALYLEITKVSGGDSASIVESVRDELNDFSRYMPVGINTELFSDSTVQISQSIGVLQSNALFGLFLVVLILFLFTGLRNALITSLGIPVTFALTFLILEFSGETLNTNTLFGLVLVLGLIVDHAIVITENAYRLQQQGLVRHEAAVKGTDQVVWPVIAASATTVAAFLPLMILPGTIGRFLRVIPFTVSVALAASTLEALFFLPSHYADWPGGKKQAAGLLDRPVRRLQKRFRSLAGHLYRRRGLSLLILVLLVTGLFSLSPFVKQDLFSAEDFTLFYIDVEMPAGTSAEITGQFLSRIEDAVLPSLGNGEITGVLSTIGFGSGDSGGSYLSSRGQIIVDLPERSEGRERSIGEIMQETQERIRTFAGAEEVSFRKATNGPPVSAPVSYRVFGDDYRQLQDIASAITARLDEYPELYNIKNNIDAGTPELRIRVDEVRAAELGLSVASVGAYLRGVIDGTSAGVFFGENKELDIRVNYDFSHTSSGVAAIENMKIPSPSGKMIPFSSIARIVEGDPPASIKRLDGKREVTVEASAWDESRIREINAEIERYFDEEVRPGALDLELQVGGEFSDLDDLIIQIARIFLIGIFLMYMILGTQFNSYSQPFLVLATLPFAFGGIVLYLAVSGTPFSTTVLYAAVALAGIAVNDAIVLISFINEERDRGESVSSAVLSAAEIRMRPILLTSVTTIAGLIPAAVGIGGRSVVWGPMASTIIFGLIFSTLSALLVIPLLYGFFYDRAKIKRGRQDRSEISDSSEN